MAIAFLLFTLLALDNCCKLAFAIAIYILLASHKNVKDLFVAVLCANFPLRFSCITIIAFAIEMGASVRLHVAVCVWLPLLYI